MSTTAHVYKHTRKLHPLISVTWD